MSKRQKYVNQNSHSLSPNPHKNYNASSNNNLGKQSINSSIKDHTEFQSQIYQFNFKVLSRQPTLRNIQKILFTLNFVNLARYQSNGNYWNYLKVKGPAFLIIDKYGQIKIAILNQCNIQNQVIHIQSEMKFQLKNLGYDGYILNYSIQDSITGNNIYGIWTTDKNIQKLWTYLKNHLTSKNELK